MEAESAKEKSPEKRAKPTKTAAIDKAEIKTESKSVETSVQRYPTIKRLLATLDKFLDRRVAGIAFGYVAAMLAIAVGFYASSMTPVNASGEGASGLATRAGLDALLYSLVGVLTLVFIAITVRVIMVCKHNQKHAAPTPPTKN